MGLLLVATIVASCSIPELSIDGKACPCVAGFVCDLGLNVCVRGDRNGLDSGLIDGSSTDAAPSGEPANIHDHGTFETGCASWNSFRSSVQSSAIARSGARSCQFCADGTVTAFAADDRGFLFEPTLGRFRAVAWARASSGTPPIPIHLFIRTLADGVEVERAQSDPVPVGETWQRFEASLVVTKPAAVINLVVWADAGAGTCFLLDDVTAYREREL